MMTPLSKADVGSCVNQNIGARPNIWAVANFVAVQYTRWVRGQH